MTDGEFKYDVFLSHNSKDKPEVEQLAARLRAESQAGINRPFLDKWHLPPGQNWQPLLVDAQHVSRTFAIFLSPNQVSPWHSEEAQLALSISNGEKKQKSHLDCVRHVIPVLLPGDYEVEQDYLANRTYADFRNGIEDQIGFAYLIAGIIGRAPIDVLDERGLGLPNPNAAGLMANPKAKAEKRLKILMDMRPMLDRQVVIRLQTDIMQKLFEEEQ